MLVGGGGRTQDSEKNTGGFAKGAAPRQHSAHRNTHSQAHSVPPLNEALHSAGPPIYEIGLEPSFPRCLLKTAE